jgi:hypothetical protein
MRILIHSPPSTAAPSYHRAHLPPYANIARIATSSESGERVRQWQEWQKGCTDDSSWHCRHSFTAAAIHRPTQLQLVSRSQAHLANVLDNGKSGKRGTLTVIYRRPHLPRYPTAARIAIASASGEHISSHDWRCRRREKTPTQPYPEVESIRKTGKAHRLGRCPMRVKCSDHPMTLTE